jgi:hypothetical protein
MSARYLQDIRTSNGGARILLIVDSVRQVLLDFGELLLLHRGDNRLREQLSILLLDKSFDIFSVHLLSRRIVFLVLRRLHTHTSLPITSCKTIAELEDAVSSLRTNI